MNTVCVSTIGYVVEFLKLFIIVVVLFRIKQSKKLYISFLISIFLVVIISMWCDRLTMADIYTAIAILLFIINAHEKKKAGIIILSFIGISIIDMLFACAGIIIFHMDMDTIESNPLISIAINSCSLIILIMIALIRYKKNPEYNRIQIKKYLPIYFVGGMALSVYLTALQFVGLGKEVAEYRNVLVWGLSLSGLILVIVCTLLVMNSNQNEHLKREADINASLLEAQKEYYVMLLQKENETKAFRHDIRKHIYCMNSLYNNKEYDELGKYLADMNQEVEELSVGINTGNDLITAMVNDIAEKNQMVYLQWTGMLPEDLNISSLDMCTIFYNLLSNAFEAAQKAKEHKVKVTVKFMESNMLVTIKNDTENKPEIEDGEFISSKTGEGHGYGVRNAKKYIEKNGGTYSFSYKDNIFVTEIILPNVL